MTDPDTRQNGASAATRRVGVFLGGRSSEREVSLASGRQVVMNLDRERWSPVPIFMAGDGRLWILPDKLVYQNTCPDIETRLTSDARRLPWSELRAEIDVAFLALHGKYGDDGCIQGALEMLDVPYTGSGVLTCALAQDKPFAHRVLDAGGHPVPAEIVIDRRQWERDASGVVDGVAADIGFPAVVLPAREGSSIGVGIANDAEDLRPAIDAALQHDRRALVEEYLDGMEFSVIVLEDDRGRPEALQPTETVSSNPFLTYDDKYMPGRSQKITPARVDPDMLRRICTEAERVFRTLGFRGYARLDGFLLDDGRIMFTDPNPTSGMSPSSFLFHQAAEAGMSGPMVIDRIMAAAIRAHDAKRGPL